MKKHIRGSQAQRIYTRINIIIPKYISMFQTLRVHSDLTQTNQKHSKHDRYVLVYQLMYNICLHIRYV